MTEARADILALFAEMDLEAVLVDDQATKLGGVETRAEAKVCAELFSRNRDRIEGVVVVLPNFGDEKGVADTMRMSGLNVPILVQAYPDDVTQFGLDRRRDSFCGKISVCSDLRQYGFGYTLTERHTIPVRSASFKNDLDAFVRTCKVANGMRTARLGAIGTRPDAFKTVRYSEKLLEASGIAVSVDRPVRGVRQGRQADRRPRAGRGQAGRDQGLHPPQPRAAGPARADGQARRRDRRLDGRERPRRDGHPVLALAPGDLRRQRLHAHEHHEHRR